MYSQCCWVIPFYRAVLLRYSSCSLLQLLPNSPSDCFLVEDTSKWRKRGDGWGHDTQAQVQCRTIPYVFWLKTAERRDTKLDFPQYFSNVVKLPLATVYGCILSPALSWNNFQWESFAVDTSELLALILLSYILLSQDDTMSSKNVRTNLEISNVGIN